MGQLESESRGQGGDPVLAAARAGDFTARWRALETCRAYLRLVARRGRWSSAAGHADTSDLVQKTILDGWRDFSRFQGCTPGQFRVWLKAILVHSALNARRRPAMVALELDRAAREIAGDSTSPSNRVQRESSRKALDAGLCRLSHHFRAVIHMRLWEKLSFVQIGNRLGITEDSARKLFGRAIVKLSEFVGSGHDPG